MFTVYLDNIWIGWPFLEALLHMVNINERFKDETSLSHRQSRHYQIVLTQSCRYSLCLRHYSPHIWRRYMLFQRATRCCPSGCCFDSSQEDVWAVELIVLLIHACCLLPHCWAGRTSAFCSPTFRIEGWDLDFQLPVQCDSSATDPGMGMGMKATEVSAGTSHALSEQSFWTYVSPGRLRTEGLLGPPEV